jgi:hypothetical protein
MSDLAAAVAVAAGGAAPARWISQCHTLRVSYVTLQLFLAAIPGVRVCSRRQLLSLWQWGGGGAAAAATSVIEDADVQRRVRFNPSNVSQVMTCGDR